MYNLFINFIIFAAIQMNTKMKRHSIFILLLAISTLIINTSCKKDDNLDTPSNSLEDITIPIDENSAFNMANFAKSYEQIYSFLLPYKTSFSHDVESGKALFSYQNIDGFGDFGKAICTFTHFFNDEGIILSSERKGADVIRQHLNMTLEYDYDLNGYITKVIEKQTKMFYNGEYDIYIDTIKIEYNDEYKITKQIINSSNISSSNYSKNKRKETKPSKTHIWEMPPKPQSEKTKGENIKNYHYDADGKLISIEDSNLKYDFNYSGNLINKTDYYKFNSLWKTYNFSFNSYNKYNHIEYSDYELDITNSGHYIYEDKLIYQRFFEGSLVEYREYIENLRLSNFTFYYLYSNSYCISTDYDSNGRPSKKSYLEQTETSIFELLGYITIDERNPDEGYYKSHESAFNATNDLLFYSQYSYQSLWGTGEFWRPSYFYSNGDPMDVSYIQENYEWSYDLLTLNNYQEEYYFVSGNAME